MRWRTKALEAAVVLCAGLGLSPATGQDEVAKLLPADGELEDYFGHALAICGDTAVIGTQYDDDNGENAGAAYIFHYDGSNWLEQAKLAPADPAASDLFGCAVAIDGDVIVVGAEEADDHGVSSGAAYVFRFSHASDTWVQRAKLLPDDGAADNLFGHSVAVSGDVALVAMSGVSGAGDYTGSAYIFRFDQGQDLWVQEAKLAVSDGAEADLFGVSVALDGNTAVIAAPYDDDNGSESGSVYIFAYNGAGWSQQAKLHASDAAANDFFGCSVDVSGHYLVAGAHWDDDKGEESGSAYVFHRDGDTWEQQAKLLAADGAEGDAFGTAVAIEDDTILVGVPHDDSSGTSSGSVYVFYRHCVSWTQVDKLTSSDGEPWDLFGSSAGISGNHGVFGALRNDDAGSNSGSAYVFDVACCPGDLDGDDDCDQADLAQLLGNYGMTGGACYEDGDLDGDGDVELGDLAELLHYYGAVCD